MHRRMMGIGGLLLATAMVAAACGGGEEAPPGASPTSTPTTPTPTFTTLKSGVLNVGSCLEYKPFEYYEKSVLKGFDVEMMQAVAQRLGLTLEWTKANFETIFTALAGGKFDAVAAASTITPERSAIVNFSIPYYNALLSLTVNTSESPDVATTDDLQAGDVVGVQKGTTGKQWATDNLVPKGIEIKTFTKVPDAYTDLEGGQVTAVVDDEPSARAEVEGRANLKVVQSIDAKQVYGIATSKDNPSLKAAMDATIRAIIADGTYAQLFKKYFPTLTLPAQFQPTG